MSTPAPASGRPRRELLLVGVLVIVFAAGYFWWWAPAGSAPAASNPVAGPVPAAESAAAVPDDVKLDALEDVPAVVDVGRNPFVFGTRPAPPPPPAPAYAPPVDAGPVQPLAPQGPPPIGLQLAGMTVVSEGARTMVTLKDPGTNALYQAYEGDIVDGRYRVVKVGVQSVVLSYVDGTGLRTIPLAGG